MDWKPIAEARFVAYGTVADLKMSSGRVYRAVWGMRGHIGAWWPLSQSRKSPIGLYEPEAFHVVEEGDVEHSDWAEGARRQHAARAIAEFEVKQECFR